ncbi:MAG: large conductance mechanosensitive channel protein MscL [Candidatus Limnocylindrales bacterium]
MLSEFKGFLLRTNALALAVGVIIGAAAGTVVTSLVDDIIMPPIGLALGGQDFADLKFVLRAMVGDDPSTEVAIRWGAFFNALLTFVIIAFVVFWISKMFLKEAPPTPVKACPFCMEANALDATRCQACTSEI